MTSRFFECALFPPIEIDGDSGYWVGDIELAKEVIEMSVYVDGQIGGPGLEGAARLVAELARLRDRGMSAIEKRASRDDSLVWGFFRFHLHEAPETLPDSIRTQGTAEALLGALKLSGIGLHRAEDADFELVLDFSFGRQQSDELLAVKFSPDGAIRDVCHES